MSRFAAAKALRAPALDQFEKQAAIEGFGKGMQEFTAGFAVIQQMQALQPGQFRVVQPPSGGQVVIVIIRHRQQGRATTQRRDRFRDVARGERDVLHARARHRGDEAPGRRRRGVGYVQRQTKTAALADHGAALH